jgi:hypothetical protein
MIGSYSSFGTRRRRGRRQGSWTAFRFLLGVAAVAIVGGYGYQVGVSATQASNDKLEADLQRFQEDNLGLRDQLAQAARDAGKAQTALEEVQRRYAAEVPDGQLAALLEQIRADRGTAACRRRRRAPGLPDRCRGPGAGLRRGTGHQALPAAHADLGRSGQRGPVR